MECYVKLDRVYDSLTPYHGSWRIYRNVVTGQDIEVEEGENETVFTKNNFILTWEEYQRRLEHEKYGISTDQVEKYGLIGRNYDRILNSLRKSLEEVLPKTQLFYEGNKGYFNIHFLELLQLIREHREINVFHTYENEGYHYHRKTSYDSIDSLYRYYTETSLRLFLMQFYKKDGITEETARQKVEELIYHLLANHEGVFKTCDNLLDIEEFRSLLTEEELETLLCKEMIPWTIRIPSPYDYDSLMNGLVKLSYKGTSPTECAVINQGELNSYLRQNLQTDLSYLYGNVLTDMSRDFPVLLPFIHQQEEQDSRISLESKNKVYSFQNRIFK